MKDIKITCIFIYTVEDSYCLLGDAQFDDLSH